MWKDVFGLWWDEAMLFVAAGLRVHTNAKIKFYTKIMCGCGYIFWCLYLWWRPVLLCNISIISYEICIRSACLSVEWRNVMRRRWWRRWIFIRSNVRWTCECGCVCVWAYISTRGGEAGNKASFSLCHCHSHMPFASFSLFYFSIFFAVHFCPGLSFVHRSSSAIKVLRICNGPILRFFLMQNDSEDSHFAVDNVKVL